MCPRYITSNLDINPGQSRFKTDHLFKSEGLIEHKIYSEQKQTYPGWFNELSDTEKALIVEFTEAKEIGFKALPLMGIRALLENTIVPYIGDQKGLKKNFDKFTEEDYIAKQSPNTLYKVIDAGSALTHRQYIPSDEDVTLCLDMVINVIQLLTILQPEIERLYDDLPKRT